MDGLEGVTVQGLSFIRSLQIRLVNNEAVTVLGPRDSAIGLSTVLG